MLVDASGSDLEGCRVTLHESKTVFAFFSFFSLEYLNVLNDSFSRVLVLTREYTLYYSTS